MLYVSRVTEWKIGLFGRGIGIASLTGDDIVSLMDAAERVKAHRISNANGCHSYIVTEKQRSQLIAQGARMVSTDEQWKITCKAIGGGQFD